MKTHFGNRFASEIVGSDEELASRLFKGGMTVSKTGAPVEMISLERDAKFQATCILPQGEKEFPRSSSHSEFREFRESVNANVAKLPTGCLS